MSPSIYRPLALLGLLLVGGCAEDQAVRPSPPPPTLGAELDQAWHQDRVQWERHMSTLLDARHGDIPAAHLARAIDDFNRAKQPERALTATWLYLRGRSLGRRELDSAPDRKLLNWYAEYALLATTVEHRGRIQQLCRNLTRETVCLNHPI